MSVLIDLCTSAFINLAHVVYRLFTYRLPLFTYCLTTPCLPDVFLLFTPRLPRIYHLSTPRLPLVYLLSIPRLPLANPSSTPRLPLVYLSYTSRLPAARFPVRPVACRDLRMSGDSIYEIL